MIMMVTDISVAGVQRCQRQFNLLGEQQLDDVPLAIIANKFKGGFGSGNIAKQAESALGRKINCLVRTDDDTACAARDQGVLLQDIKAGSRIVKDLHAFLVKVRPTLLAARDARVEQVAAI
jgi:pilus assembly protein CpaE